MRRSVGDCLWTDDVAGFVCSHIEGVHTLTLRLIKEKIRGNLRPYPLTLGWARRIGRVFGLTSRIDIDYIVEDSIESISFHSLVARYKVPRIDLIVIDTEGYDLEILRQLDLLRFKPDLIVYEHKHLNELERTIAADLLIANGYSVQSTAWANTVALRLR